MTHHPQPPERVSASVGSPEKTRGGKSHFRGHVNRPVLQPHPHLPQSALQDSAVFLLPHDSVLWQMPSPHV